MERFARSLRTLVALAVCGSMTGCGGYGALCVDAMDCEGGNDADVEACEIRAEYMEDYSVLHGCEPEWEDLVVCFEQEARCSNSAVWCQPANARCLNADGVCDPERLDWLNCADIGFTL